MIQNHQDIHLTCKQHPDKIVEFFSYNQQSKYCQLFCSHCISKGLRSSTIHLEEIFSEEIIHNWPPLKDEQLHYEISEFVNSVALSNQINYHQNVFTNILTRIRSQIESYLTDLDKKLKVEFERHKKENQFGRFCAKYREISKADEFKQLLKLEVSKSEQFNNVSDQLQCFMNSIYSNNNSIETKLKKLKENQDLYAKEDYSKISKLEVALKKLLMDNKDLLSIEKDEESKKEAHQKEINQQNLANSSINCINFVTSISSSQIIQQSANQNRFSIMNLQNNSQQNPQGNNQLPGMNSFFPASNNIHSEVSMRTGFVSQFNNNYKPKVCLAFKKNIKLSQPTMKNEQQNRKEIVNQPFYKDQLETKFKFENHEHESVFQLKKQPNLTQPCFMCGNYISNNHYFWDCRQCDLDICLNCSAETHPTFKNYYENLLKHNATIDCEHEHDLLIQRYQISQQRSCDKCSHKISSYYWSCSSCEYDVCVQCSPHYKTKEN